MIVSMPTLSPIADASTNAAAGAAKDATGDTFDRAVQDAAPRQQNRRSDAKGGATHENKAVAPDADAVAKDRIDGETGDDAKADDALDQLLGGVLAAIARTPAGEDGTARAETPRDEEAEAEEDPLKERIVITTVAALADKVAEKARTRVSLEVLRMETHFEPGLEASIVEADGGHGAASADRLAASADDGGDGVKLPFQEMLQRLGQTSDGEAETGSRHRPSHRDDARNPDVMRAPAADAKSSPVDEPTKADPRAPSSFPSMSAQVAQRIVEAFPASVTPLSQTAAQPQAGQFLRMTAGGAALKTLSIQLQPQDLGRLDVSMRLVDGRLTVELAASEAATARALAGDRHGLRKLLEHAGFALDDAAITVVTRDVGMLAAQPSAASANPGDGKGGAPTGRQQSGEESRSGERPGGGQPQDQRPPARPKSESPRRASSVFDYL